MGMDVFTAIMYYLISGDKSMEERCNNFGEIISREKPLSKRRV